MRTKEQFKAYVYDKANEKRLLKKRARMEWVRGFAAFSLLFIISGALIYGNFIFKAKDVAAEASLYENRKSAENFFYSKSTVLENDVQVQAVCDDEFVAEIAAAESGEITQEKAIEIAKEKCTVNYDTTSVDFDADSQVWKVVFCSQNTPGGCQTIYINADGAVCSIEYGE